MRAFHKPLQDLAQDTKSYVDLQVGDLKLKVTKGLSLSLGQVLAFVLVIFTLGIVFLALAAAGVLLLGKWLGSYVLGCLVVAGIFAVVAAILLALRGKLFVNTFVKLFAGILFEEDSPKTTLSQLEEDQEQITRQIASSRSAIGKDVARVQRMFEPLSLAGAGWHLVAPKAKPLDNVLVGFIRGLKRAVGRIL